MDAWQALWTGAYRYGRKARLSPEQAEDFAQYACMAHHEGDQASLGLLFCRFTARGRRGLDRAKKLPPPSQQGDPNGKA